MVFIKRETISSRKTSGYVVLLGCLGFMLGGEVQSGVAVRTNPDSADTFPGQIVVNQVQQMSVVIETPAGVIYTDPTRGKARYAEYPVPDLILISHEHHEHFDSATLRDITGPNTRIVVPPYVMKRLPVDLKSNAISLANGAASNLSAITVEAIPAYGMKGQSAHWHPVGRGNGYLVTVDGQKMYIAGSTDATPEMLQLRNIHIAFLPLYPPYALGVDDAIEAIAVIKPRFTYIYQYNSVSTRDAFVRKLKNNLSATTVIARDINP